MNAWHNPKSYAPDCGELLAESWDREAVEAHLKQLARKVVWQRRVKALCLAVAVFAAVYFGGQLLRVFL